MLVESRQHKPVIRQKNAKPFLESLFTGSEINDRLLKNDLVNGIDIFSGYVNQVHSADE